MREIIVNNVDSYKLFRDLHNNRLSQIFITMSLYSFLFETRVSARRNSDEITRSMDVKYMWDMKKSRFLAAKLYF